MKNKPVAFIIGGTYPHKRLIQLLKKRGYYTILIDYLEYSPAKEDSDLHLQESTLDKDRVLELAKEFNAKLVISTCIDQANVTACYVSEKLGLPAPYSYLKSLEVTNKKIMKKILINNNIITANYVELGEDDIEDFELGGLSFPLIVKPTDSNSSKGVYKIESYSSFKKLVSESVKYSRESKIIVEEYIEGREIAFDTIIKNGKADLIISRERCKLENNASKNQQIFGSIWPADLTKLQEQKYRTVIQNIAKAFELDNTTLMVQTILRNNEIYVIEFAPRIGGGDNYDIILKATGCDIIDVAIDSYLNNTLTYNYAKPDIYFLDNYLYMNEGFFGEITGVKELIKNNIIEYCKVYKQKGSKIGSEMSSNNRVGVVTVKANCVEDLFKKRKKILTSIKLLDIDGNNIKIT